VAVCDGNRAWIEWAGFEKDDHRLIEIVCPRLKRLAIAPEDCFADDGGLGKIVINPFEREWFYLRRIGKTPATDVAVGGPPVDLRVRRGYFPSRASGLFEPISAL
jgi:hypothetical protein